MGPDADSRAFAQRIYMPLICPDSQSDSEAYFRVIETEPIISVTQAFSFCNRQKSIHKEKFGNLLKRLPSAPRRPFRRLCFPIFRRSSGRKKTGDPPPQPSGCRGKSPGRIFTRKTRLLSSVHKPILLQLKQLHLHAVILRLRQPLL